MNDMLRRLATERLQDVSPPTTPQLKVLENSLVLNSRNYVSQLMS